MSNHNSSIVKPKRGLGLSLSEIVFITILSAALGISWWAYSFLYDIIEPPLKAIAANGLIEGFWQIGGVFFAYVIRKPGSALLGEVIAALVEGMISQWGLSDILYGICQGLPVEIVFLLCGYKIWTKSAVSIAGAAAAIGGYVVTYYLYHYAAFGVKFNLINLSCSAISGAVLGGLLAKYIADKLATTGVLNQYRISQSFTVNPH